jgi:MFS family permease
VALILLVLINLFNYLDRQVLAAVEPEVRAHFFPKVVDEEGEHESKGWFNRPAKFWTGMLATAFLVTYMLTAPIFGWLANRMSRWVLIGIGVLIWTIASGGSGLAATFLIMFLTRCCVGIGEAVYGPVAPDVISDLFPVKKRGQVLAWFYAAIPVGGAIGYILGGQIVSATGDWRPAFYYVVPPGILLGLWCFFLREPKRGQVDHANLQGRKTENWRDYLILLKTPSYVLNTLGMTAMVFAMGGLAQWAKGYLIFKKAEPVLGVEPVSIFGGLTVLLGLLATLAGGWAGDALRGRFPGSYFLVSGAAMIVGFPMLLLVIWLKFPVAWIPLALFIFCLFFNTGPTNTILANVTHPLLRAPGFAFNILFIHLFGDAFSPPLMGEITGENNYNTAFLVVSFTVLLGGIFWLWGARYLERDTALAPTRLPAA